MQRTVKMQQFLDASALALRAVTSGAAARAAEAVIERWASPGATGQAPARVPACNWIAPALASVDPQRADLADAFAAVLPDLRWAPRTTSEGTFRDAHANAVVLGPGGLETRDDFWVGATVMAPNVRYVDHDHAPEEVYLSLTPGEWWNAQMDWTDPGPGGFIYNPPGIRHAMRSGSGPFLALWYLPL